MFRKVLLSLICLIALGILLAILAWTVFGIPSPLSEPIDCMPGPVFGDEEEVKPNLWERLFGTRCVTY